MSDEAFIRGVAEARRRYAQAWADATGTSIEETEFTTDFIKQELAKLDLSHAEEVEPYCDALREWADLVIAREKGKETPDRELVYALHLIDAVISKSCLLSRTIYGGEKPSQTPCPVHKGQWAGCHGPWPGQKWSDGEPAEPSEMCQEWYDAGCRCFQHSCGCTTGWQPDEHCGCLKEGESDGG